MYKQYLCVKSYTHEFDKDMNSLNLYDAIFESGKKYTIMVVSHNNMFYLEHPKVPGLFSISENLFNTHFIDLIKYRNEKINNIIND